MPLDTNKASLPSGLEREARLTLAQVSTMTGWGRTKIYAEIRSGNFPEPSRSGKRCSRWRAGDVIETLSKVGA